MAGWTRRTFLATGFAAAGLAAEGHKGASFPSAFHRYVDPTTEFDVYRLTDPAYVSTLPAYYNRAIARNSSWMLYSPAIAAARRRLFRLDLKSGETRQLTDAEDLDPRSVTLTPDNRSVLLFRGAVVVHGAACGAQRERELYKVPDGWERCPGMTVGPDGTHATFAEQHGDGSRLRMVSLVQGVARTVVEAPFAMSDPIPRPMRAQVDLPAGRHGAVAGEFGRSAEPPTQAGGRADRGAPTGRPTGRRVLYLNLPGRSQAVERHSRVHPDTNSDKLVAKTSQYAAFRSESRHLGVRGREPQRRVARLSC